MILALFLLILLFVGVVLIYTTFIINDFEKKVNEFSELLNKRYQLEELNTENSESEI